MRASVGQFTYGVRSIWIIISRLLDHAGIRTFRRKGKRKKKKRKEKRERKKRKGGGEKHNSNKSFMLPSIQLLMYETVEQSKLIKVF